MEWSPITTASHLLNPLCPTRNSISNQRSTEKKIQNLTLSLMKVEIEKNQKIKLLEDTLAYYIEESKLNPNILRSFFKKD